MKTDYSHQDTAVALAIKHEIGQFIYPTGTGKTLIQARIIAEHVRLNPGFGIYVVLAPRILLAQQLFRDIHSEVVQKQHVDCAFFALHCGKATTYKDALKKTRAKSDEDEDSDDDAIFELSIELHKAGITQTVFDSGTNRKKVKEAIARATKDDVPLIICSTYHSMMQLDTIPLDILLADEAHHLVGLNFSEGHNLDATKRFFFTASRKVTDGDEGLGMNNHELFGDILDILTGAEAVARKLIVRPRLHYVEIEQPIEVGAEHFADIVAIEKTYAKHRMMTAGLAPKVLISCRGSKHLKLVLKHSDCFAKLRRTNPGLQVFSILSGKENVQIDGVTVTREVWFERLRALRDNEPCIIMHYDIISEGIDVPGITGIMPLRNLTIGKFLQTNGRGSRLHATDRLMDLPVDGLAWDTNFVKPYSWIIVPCYTNLGDDIRSSIEKYVGCLREFGWIPDEDVINTTAGGDNEPDVLGDLIKRGEKLPKMVDDVLNVVQRIEVQEATNLLNDELRGLSTERLMDQLRSAA